MISICFVYFRSLTVANLAAALMSLRWQDFSNVREIIFVDNNTEDDSDQLVRIVSAFEFPVNVRMRICKHGDPSKTHSWSTNEAVGAATAPWVFFTRADYILQQDAVRRFSEQANAGNFVTSNAYQLHVDIAACNDSGWRAQGAEALKRLPGTEIDYTVIDTGVWMTTRALFQSVGGLSKDLTAWGHAQTHFQHKLFKAGVEFVRIPEALYFHPMHGAERNIDAAHAQLSGLGVDLREMWARYHGPRVY